MRSAFTTAALLDIDFAITVYLDAGKRDRKVTLENLASGFSSTVGKIVENVSSAATGLEGAARTLTKTAEYTQQISGTVASASEEASANVQSVASATEEMTSSVNAITRQGPASTKIAAAPLPQPPHTDPP